MVQFSYISGISFLLGALFCFGVFTDVKAVCYDDANDCADRWTDMRDVTLDQFRILTKECRKTCDLCCACEAGCNIMYQTKGCWKDMAKNKRTLPNLLITDRDRKSPKYEAGFPGWKNWTSYVPDFTCRCAKAAVAAGYKYFGIQFYQECWAGNEFDPNFGEGDCCYEGHWNKCALADLDYCCAGGKFCNYVYEIPFPDEVDPCSFK